MSAAREAILLPAIFLTVTLLGGLRIAGDVRLIPPALSSLVLAMLLVGALARTRVLALDVLMNARRSPLENASGAIVLVSLFAATAQAFNLLTPERGLLHALFTVFFAVHVLTTLAAVSGRQPMLRALFVLLGSAFVLRFIVLESVYSPGGGLFARMLTAALEGVTLGSFEYTPNAPVTGYIAFGALALYLAGLVLLPPPAITALDRTADAPRLPVSLGALMLAAALVSAGCGPRAAGAPEDGDASPAGTATNAAYSEESRQAALRSARVWRPPDVPIAKADLKDNVAGPRPIDANTDVSCRLVLEPVSGTTPKFNCELAGGEVVKIKYGAANPELRAEVAASRLLHALGFGADLMSLVRTVHCAGCPALPFEALRCLTRTGLQTPCFGKGVDYEHVTSFAPAAIERRFPGEPIATALIEGWAWYELDVVDAAHGGSPRADLDALRLMAVLLAHWDNKAENQRLVCLPGARRADGACGESFALIQDVGATFGPTKLDLRNWRATPVWTDPGSCTVSMGRLPFGGATFPERRISEAGRRKLLGLLEQLSQQQLVDLFTGAGVTRFEHLDAAARDAGQWAAAFLDKVRQIREGGPCG
jgi:hypothetical protein